MSVRILHKYVAIVLLIFIVSHLVTHLTAIGGIDNHNTALEMVRPFYRPIFIEVPLIILFAAQIILGLILFARRWPTKDRSGWSWTQLISGAYLMIFIIMHLSAALIARASWGLDTNFYWPAGTLTFGSLIYGFAPYYGLAILAIFGHIAAASHFRGFKKLPYMLLIMAVILGLTIILIFSGALFPIELPDEHLRYFSSYA